MKKYKVRYLWEKYIDYPIIEAKNKKEAKKIAEEDSREIMATENATEQMGKDRWEITELNKPERQTNKKRCPACNGLGNVDEAMGFACDCIVCSGTGYIEQ